MYFFNSRRKIENLKYGIDKFIEGLLTDKHPKKNVKNKYKILEELKLIKSQLTK